jgi:hypothetical protein
MLYTTVDARDRGWSEDIFTHVGKMFNSENRINTYCTNFSTIEFASNFTNFWKSRCGSVVKW